MTIVYLIILSCISAILYRMGGCSKADYEKEWSWTHIPYSIPKKRDVFANIITLVAALLVGVSGPWFWWFIAFGLTWASLSTYWDFLFGYDNHYAHGFMIAFSMLPLAFYGEPLALGIRCALLAILMGVYSQIEGNATREELGRGFVMPISLLICLWV